MFKQIIPALLREFANKIESDTCELSTEDALNILSSIAHIKINKQEVADLLKISTKTVERKEFSGELPPSHICPCTKKNWWLDEIIIKQPQGYWDANEKRNMSITLNVNEDIINK